MKKILTVILFSIAVFTLAGCTKKSTTTSTKSPSSSSDQVITLTPTNLEDTSNQNATEPTGNEVPLGSTTPTATAAATGSSKATATAASQILSENYTKAAQNAQLALKGKATFCTVFIEFSPLEGIAMADQSYFFTGVEENLKDWYWVVKFNALEKKQQVFLAAKSGFEDEITCTSFKDGKVKLGFEAAFQRAEDSGSITSGSNIAQYKISLKERSWQIEAISIDGQVASQNEVDATNAFVSSTAKTKTPTSNL